MSLCIFMLGGRTEEGTRSPGIGVTGSCEPPHTGPGNCLWVFWKSRRNELRGVILPVPNQDPDGSE